MIRIAAAVLGGIALVFAFAGIAGGEVRVRSAAFADAAAGYWTPERIARARPIGIERSTGADRGSSARAAAPPFTSGPVPDPTVFPNTVNGKLFGVLRGFGSFECSATVVDTISGRVILTAGHCVFDPGLGRFAKRLTFIPAFAGGAQPLGRWGWLEAATTRQWARRGNSNFDFATIVLRRDRGVAVEDVAGGLPLRTNGPREQTYGAVGYPANRGGGERMWGCSSDYAGPDPRPFRVGRDPVGIGCDMGAGASGGGWTNPAGELVSLSSFGYRDRPDLLFGPYLGVKAARLFNRSGSL